MLGGSEVGWENAVLHGPAVAMQETLVSVMRNGAHAWHGLLAEPWQPIAWWRILHGVLVPSC